jgi:hypothetical protein
LPMPRRPLNAPTWNWSTPPTTFIASILQSSASKRSFPNESGLCSASPGRSRNSLTVCKVRSPGRISATYRKPDRPDFFGTGRSRPAWREDT